MAFVRRKRVKGKDYYFLVENRREGQKVKQITLFSLGTASTIEAAIKAKEVEKERLEALVTWLLREYNREMKAWNDMIDFIAPHFQHQLEPLPMVYSVEQLNEADIEALRQHMLKRDWEPSKDDSYYWGTWVIAVHSGTLHAAISMQT